VGYREKGCRVGRDMQSAALNGNGGARHTQDKSSISSFSRMYFNINSKKLKYWVKGRLYLVS
jgi:hypothetical protein